MKNTILILLGFLLLSCNKQSTSVDSSNQIEFIKAQINRRSSDLITHVEETGYSPAGKEFIEISEKLSEKTQNLISKIDNGEIPQKEVVHEIIDLANNRYDTIPIDSLFITQAYNKFKQTGNKEIFKVSLLLFNADFINSIHSKFSNYFQHVDYFIPIPVGDKFTIRKGDSFNGMAISQAKMVAIKYLYEIDDPQTDEGFVELPYNVASKYDGIINIKGKEVGVHKIKLRSTHWQNGKKISFENEFELEVTE